ncbi:MAG: GC-type dockerin domain-anchored protein [Planctomycetota bacterium]|nr:GC-type dockerin domain-anchored protein [Planctomycetota bacterium]
MTLRTNLLRWALPALCVAGAARAQTFSVVDPGLPDLGTDARATALSGSGWLVGEWVDADGLTRGFRWRAGQAPLDLGFLPNMIECRAAGVNDSGQVVGWCSRGFNNTGTLRPFYWSDATGMRDLGTLDGSFESSATALAINNLGLVAGRSDAAGEPVRPTHAAAWTINPSTGAVLSRTDLHTGAPNLLSVAVAVNDAGQIAYWIQELDSLNASRYFSRRWPERITVGPSSSFCFATAMSPTGAIAGVAFNFGVSSAWFWTGPTPGPGTTLPASDAAARGINSAGDVVGELNSGFGPQRGFLFRGGLVRDLNTLLRPEDSARWTITRALAITDSGRIAAVASATINGSPRTRAVILTPCLADYDHSGFVDSDDFVAFSEDFAAGRSASDIDGSGFIDSDDFVAFVARFSVGCP